MFLDQVVLERRLPRVREVTVGQQYLLQGLYKIVPCVTAAKLLLPETPAQDKCHLYNDCKEIQKPIQQEKL